MVYHLISFYGYPFCIGAIDLSIEGVLHLRRTAVCFVVVVIFILLICPPVLAVFTPPESSVTQKEAAYAEKVWVGISWDTSRVKAYNELSVKLPRVSVEYSWSVGMDTGQYVGIDVNSKSIYLGHGGQDVVLGINPEGNGIYLDLIHIKNGVMVGSETYIYKPETGVKLIPPEERVKGAVDEKGNVVGLYDVWGKQIVNDSVYSHQINRFITFPDVKTSNWAYSAIYKMAAAGYVSGYPNKSFKPDSSTTRAEFIVILNKILSDKYSDGAGSSSNITFPDLKPGYWSYQQTKHLFSYMAPNDVTNIFGAKFTPDKYITREEVAAVLYSTLKNHPRLKDHVIKKAPFIDTGSSKDRDGINFCYSEGLMTGYPDKLFKAKANITRAEMAALMCKVYDLIQ